ncbi:SapC family protein [Stenotrophomonas nematodicola]|uniref:SapC family protein n=1 Tax=Stenotrophomonas nematodicola TaxID=2656746 RepID=UPI003D9A4A86
MTAETNTPAAAAAPTGPLFYRQTVPLSAEAHANWRLRTESASFAAGTNSLPVVVGEFGSIAQFYPILFTGKEAVPLAAVGLAKDNLFVTDGYWAADHYVPAYVRRYPFVFIQTDDPQNYVLGLDAEAEQVNQGDSDEGQPLFENGEPTELVNAAMRFCGDFTREHELTRQFSAALIEQGLLVDRSIDVTLSTGAQMSINGFRVVDVEKFSKLPDALVVAWHRNGWLALVHHHLSSLARFNALVQRQSAVPLPATA